MAIVPGLKLNEKTNEKKDYIIEYYIIIKLVLISEQFMS